MSEASVQVAGRTTARIGNGLVVLVAVERGDRPGDAEYLADKVVHLRVFPDGQDRMNLSLLEAGGELLVVSQFTLAGDCRKGRRPSFDRAEDPARAQELYEAFIRASAARGAVAKEGTFRAHMDVSLTNSGPVTLLLSTRKEF